MKLFGDERDWFFHSRLGMFVHWGLYALPAWHEQLLWRGSMKRADYEPLMHSFNPTAYDPDTWLDLCESAHMDSVVFTAKHHDGFCMYDTAYSDYKITNTPYGRDVLDMLANACARRNVKLGIYYSLPDWHHKNYPNQGRHHEMFGPRPGDEPDEERYLEYVRNQVVELCTRYGTIWQFFWDVNVAGFDDPSINETLRRLHPQMVINDRGPGPGDYDTPERKLPESMSYSRPTQACQSLGRQSWGYREREDYYTVRFMMESIARTLCLGGNYLLNVGPCADGSIAEPYKKAFAAIGDWYARVGEAFRDTLPASHLLQSSPSGGSWVMKDEALMTRRGNTLYACLCAPPQTCGFSLRPLTVRPSRITLLNDGREIDGSVELIPWLWTEKPYLHLFNLPVEEFASEVMVVRMEMDDAVI
ncbi:MAG: glycoside hydrolase [Clostridiales bacterium]|nr:glycoside hydrolase [Clostridiales bacterium]